jgi:hypothetical protein
MGTADWAKERFNISVNTPASWSLRMWLGMSGLPAMRGLTRFNVLLTSATENESQQSLRPASEVPCYLQRVKEFNLSWSKTSVSDLAGFPFVIRDCLESLLHV